MPKKIEELDVETTPENADAADASTPDAGETAGNTGDPISISIKPDADGSAPNQGVQDDPDEVMRQERLYMENHNGALTTEGEVDQDAAIEQQKRIESGELPSWEGDISHEAVNMVLVYPHLLNAEIEWARENTSQYALLRIRENLLAAAARCL